MMTPLAPGRAGGLSRPPEELSCAVVVALAPPERREFCGALPRPVTGVAAPEAAVGMALRAAIAPPPKEADDEGNDDGDDDDIAMPEPGEIWLEALSRLAVLW